MSEPAIRKASGLVELGVAKCLRALAESGKTVQIGERRGAKYFRAADVTTPSVMPEWLIGSDAPVVHGGA